MSANASGADKRQQIRFAVVHPAVLVLDGSQRVAGEIRDFCMGGLFFRFTPPAPTQEFWTSLKNPLAQVQFEAPGKGGNRSFSLATRLVRVNDFGAGLVLSEAPFDALRALQKISVRARLQKFSTRVYGEDSARLRDEARSLLLDILERSTQEWLAASSEKLQLEAGRAPGIEEYRGLLAAQEEVKLSGKAAAADFIRRVEAGFSKPKAAEASTPWLDSSFALVEKEEFEDWLSVAGEANRIVESLAETWYQVDRGLEAVYGFVQHGRDNPFAAAALLDAFRRACQGLKVSPRARQVLYKTYSEALGPHLEVLYGRLAEILPAPAEDIHAPSVEPPVAHGSATPNPAEAPTAPQPDAVATPPAASGPQNAPAGPEPQTPGAFSRMAGALFDLFRKFQAPATPAASAGGATTSSAQPPAPLQPGQALARKWQERVTQGPADPVLAQKLAAAQSDPAAQQSLNVFGSLLEAIHGEKSLAAGARPYLDRLERPLLRMAMTDPRYLNSPEHAAHRVVNALDRLTLVASDDGRISDEQLLKIINRWTQRIEAESAKNPAVFEEARVQLEKVLKPLLKARGLRITRLLEVCEARQHMEKIRRSVEQKLIERLGSATVPRLLLDLLDGGWQAYLLRLTLRLGETAEETLRAWGVLDQLLSAAGGTSLARREARSLLEYVETRLALVNPDVQERDQLADKLAGWLFGHSPDLEQAAFRARTDDDALLPLSESHASQLAKVQLGDWYQFQGSPLPLQLVWLGEDPALYVFANYRGIRKLEWKARELAERLDSGQASRCENLDQPLMDRSFGAMIQHLHRYLLQQTSHDAETGLMDRKSFQRELRRSRHIVHAKAEQGQAVAVLDVEDLRLLKEGASPADYQEQLTALAALLAKNLPAEAPLARFGEYSFAFHLTRTSQEGLRLLTERLIHQINQVTFRRGETPLSLTINVGAVWYREGFRAEELLHRADAACVAAKHEGRNRMVFEQDAGEENDAHAELSLWAARLNELTGSDQLRVVCQPVLQTGNVFAAPVFYEVLLSLRKGDGEGVDTQTFIDAVERLHRMPELDRWMVGHVFAWLRAHPDAFDYLGGLSINMSAQSINSGSFLDFLVEELETGGFPAGKIVFEITEGAAFDNYSQAERFIRQVRRYGCSFALDDFGTGFSQYAHLRNLTVDYLKIDGAFIRDLDKSEVDHALVSSMKETAAFLGVKTVAEFVENRAVLDKLREIGVDYVQGFHFGQPLPIEALLRPAAA